jgi:hypothetical protein
VILHGSVFDRAVRERIVDAFHLGGQEVTDEWDEHYDPLPEEFQF